MLEITQEQQEKLNEIGQKFNLKFIIVHGSFATGHNRKGSDLDVAVLGYDKIEFDILLKMHNNLGDVFGDNQDRELDLKSLDKKGILFKYHVARDGQLIYGDNTQFNYFKAYAYRNYVDSKSFFNLQDSLINLRLNHLKQHYA